MKDDGRCPKDILCEFERSRDLSDALIEVCVRCGKKVVYNKGPKGRINNSKYLRDHLRSTVQPFGRTRELFEKIYGHKVAIEFYKKFYGRKTKAQLKKEWEEMRIDLRRREERGRWYR